MIISFIIREQDIICIISELIQCWKLYRTKSINKVNQSDGSEFINNFVNNSICNKRIHQDERFMNRTTARQEHFKNAEVISKFYLEVLSSFIDKLYKENKYRKNIAEESIQSLQRIVKAQLNHQFPSKINQQFQNLLLKKQNSKIDDFDFQNGQSSFSKAKTSNQERLTTIKFNTQLSRGNEEDQYIDDLAQFTPVDPQKQEQPQIHLTKEAEPKEEQDDQSDSEIDYSEKIQERIGTSLIGTFCSFQIKRRPKEEKIFVQLYNVFVKYCNSPLENYYSKLTCQLTKIEKEEIKDLKR